MSFLFRNNITIFDIGGNINGKLKYRNTINNRN